MALGYLSDIDYICVKFNRVVVCYERSTEIGGVTTDDKDLMVTNQGEFIPNPMLMYPTHYA